MPNCSSAKTGFTLIEVLVSITLMAMISAVILSALRSGFLAWDRGSNHIESLRRSRIAADVISDQIRGALPLQYRVRIDDRTAARLAFEGDVAGMRFVARSSFKDGPDAGPRWIDLRWIEDSQHSAGALVEEERRIIPPDDGADPMVNWRGEVLRAAACRFDFLADSRPDEAAKWVQEWTYPTRQTLPRAVRLSCDAQGATVRSIYPLDYAASSAAGLTLQ